MSPTIKTEIMKKLPELEEARYVLEMLLRRKKSDKWKLSKEGKWKLSRNIEELKEYIEQYKKNRYILVEVVEKSCKDEQLNQTEKDLLAKYGMSD